MTVVERKAICEMLVRMERQREFSKKLGLENTSSFKAKKKREKSNSKAN